MNEQTPGELIYEYTIQSTGATSYGVPALDALLSGVADIPPQGGPVRPRLPGANRRPEATRNNSANRLHPRPSRWSRSTPHPCEITTDDGKKIALYADVVAHFTEGPPVGDLRENVTMTTSEPDYAWVNPLQIWARGTVDLAKGEAHVTGYVA